MQPRVESIRVAERPKVEPRSEQGVLDGVGRSLVVAKDQPGDRMEAGCPTGSQCREGVDIASLCPHDQLSVHHSPLPLAG